MRCKSSRTLGGSGSLASCTPHQYLSTVFQTAMFEGDVNLSCTMTFLSSLGSFAFTTLWVWVLGSPLVGRAVTIPYLQLTVSLASFTVQLQTKVAAKFHNN